MSEISGRGGGSDRSSCSTRFDGCFISLYFKFQKDVTLCARSFSSRMFRSLHMNGVSTQMDAPPPPALQEVQLQVALSFSPLTMRANGVFCRLRRADTNNPHPLILSQRPTRCSLCLLQWFPLFLEPELHYRQRNDVTLGCRRMQLCAVRFGRSARAVISIAGLRPRSSRLPMRRRVR